MGDAPGQPIVDYAQTMRRQRVGSGECFELAVAALKQGNAKTAYDFGDVAPDGDYVWGTEVPLATVRAGDILQYRDYVLTRTTETQTSLKLPDGAALDLPVTATVELKRPHHTAIVTGAPANGAVNVVEQNVDRGRGLEKLVDDGQIFLDSRPASTTTRTQSIRIDHAWGESVKRSLRGPKEKAMIDGVVKKNLGKTASAEITTTETIRVRGTLKAYRPQAK